MPAAECCYRAFAPEAQLAQRVTVEAAALPEYTSSSSFGSSIARARIDCSPLPSWMPAAFEIR
jgi:hypothetical protein